MPEDGVNKLRHHDILSYEEFIRVVVAAASQGMTKVRLTGGEPLVRKGVVPFIRRLSEIPDVADLRLTTNGVLLADMADSLLDAGIRRINVSLDSLNPDNFNRITGRDEFDRVWRGIERAIQVGFDRVKINVVVIRGVNDHEVLDLARLSLEWPLEVRFIEFMPLGRADFWSPEQLISVEEIKKAISILGPLHPEQTASTEGPANVYGLPNAVGRIGFISPVTDHFCATCNRLRLTADGKLRLCLLSNRELDLKTPLRKGADQAELVRILKQAVRDKPRAHMLSQGHLAGPGRSMNLIGG